jgi:hypothetical protein
MQKPLIAAGIYAFAALLYLVATFTTGWVTTPEKRGMKISFGFLSGEACHKGKCETAKFKKDEMKVVGYAMTTVGCLAAFAAGLAGLVLFMHKNRVKGNGAILGTKIVSAIFGMLFVLGGVAMLFVYKEALGRGSKPDFSLGWSFYVTVFATALVYVAMFLPLTDGTLNAPAPLPPPPAPEA